MFLPLLAEWAGVRAGVSVRITSMKRTKLCLRSGVLMLAVPLCASAQLSFPTAASGPVSVEAGPHHRVWQTVTTDERGRAITNSYTELATGLNFFNPATDRYEVSQEEFRTTKDGHAVANKGQHQVTLAADINSGGSV